MKSVETAPDHGRVDLRFGDFRLDRTTRRLRRLDGSEVDLAPRLFDALLYFAERPGQLLDKEQLLAALWPGLVVEENNVNQLVLALRRALGDDAQASRYIQTIPRRGFRFVAELRDLEARASPTEPPAAMPAPAGLPTPPRPRRFTNRVRYAVLAAVLAGVTVAALWRERASAPPPPARISLAVLPFKPISPEARDDALEVGMADSLVLRLSALPGVAVRSIGSSRRYAGPEQDPLRAARDLGVRWILDGSVQRVGERIRVGARLLDAADGSAAWSGSFDGRFGDVFALQDDISQRVARVLAPRLAPAQQARIAHSGTRNADAYQLYLAARYHAQGLRAEGLAQSVALYQGATRADPDFALAWSGLVETYRRMLIAGDAQPATLLQPAREAAQRALQLDPALAEARAAWGWVQWWVDWDWAGAEASFRKAAELNPNLAEAHLGLGHLLCSRQRCDEGLAHVQLARELDPLSLIGNVLEASYLLQAGRVEDSRLRVQRALQIEARFWPAHQFIAALEWNSGDVAAAEAALRQAQALAEHSVQPSANLAALLAAQGRVGDARDIVAGLTAASAHRYVPPTHVAAAYCALAERETALDWLERARAARDVNLPFLTSCWFVLRDEPRFKALREAIGLPVPRQGFCAPLQAPIVRCGAR